MEVRLSLLDKAFLFRSFKKIRKLLLWDLSVSVGSPNCTTSICDLRQFTNTGFYTSIHLKEGQWLAPIYVFCIVNGGVMNCPLIYTAPELLRSNMFHFFLMEDFFFPPSGFSP